MMVFHITYINIQCIGIRYITLNEMKSKMYVIVINIISDVNIIVIVIVIYIFLSRFISSKP